MSIEIQTYTGGILDIETMKGHITVIDIAHALSMQCRFNGHCPQFYSVAQHCVIASDIAPQEFKLQALMHDAAEAYLGDFISPLKRTFGEEYKKKEERLLEKICKNLDVPYPINHAIKMIDAVLLATEVDQLFDSNIEDWNLASDPLPMSHTLIKPVSHIEAAKMFNKRFMELQLIQEVNKAL